MHASASFRATPTPNLLDAATNGASWPVCPLPRVIKGSWPERVIRSRVSNDDWSLHKPEQGSNRSQEVQHATNSRLPVRVQAQLDPTLSRWL